MFQYLVSVFVVDPETLAQSPVSQALIESPHAIFPTGVSEAGVQQTWGNGVIIRIQPCTVTPVPARSIWPTEDYPNG